MQRNWNSRAATWKIKMHHTNPNFESKYACNVAWNSMCQFESGGVEEKAELKILTAPKILIGNNRNMLARASLLCVQNYEFIVYSNIL